MYVAFVIDCFSRAIVGWYAATVKDTAMVTTAVKMALWRRDHSGRPVADGLIHHSDRQPVHVDHILGNPGPGRDCCVHRQYRRRYDNALAESTIGLFETEAMAKSNPFHDGPFKTIEDVEYATMEWVDWFNTSRLHSRLGYVSPDAFEATHYAQISTPQPEMSPA